MATDTATIRVAREVRDQLAQQAAARGMSVAAYLADIAWRSEVEIVYAGERAAAVADQANLTTQAEQDDWESTLSDGLP